MPATLEMLDQVDPARAWEPWQPTAADPWGRKWAAHLYRRAAFGASREDLIEANDLGHQGTLELLLNGRPEADSVKRRWSTSVSSLRSAITTVINLVVGGFTACSMAATRCAKS